MNGIEIAAGAEEFFRSKTTGGRRGGRLRLLALTYEFDRNAFQRIFDRVLRLPVQVDVVTGAYEKGFAGPQQGAGLPLRVWRAAWKGTFHPKMICLLADDKVSVGVGSSNLTSPGLKERLEIWRFFSGPSAVSLLSGVRSFLDGLRQRNIVPPDARCEEIINALPVETSNRSVLLSTLRGRLVDQVVSELVGPIDRVDIVSPIEGNPSPVIEELNKKLKRRPVFHLFSNDPLPLIAGITHYSKLQRPDPNELDESEQRLLTTVHAKIFAFISGNRVDLFWGSANLSQPAWIASGDGANIDVLVHTLTTLKQWERFRDGLPSAHEWKGVQPTSFQPTTTKRDLKWRMLHATADHGKISIAAVGRADALVQLEVNDETASERLEFRERDGDCRALLSHESTTKLKLHKAPYPQCLLVRRDQGEWNRIPLNDLGAPVGSEESSTLEDRLLWEFTGRAPKRGKALVKPKVPGTPTDDVDEDELEGAVHKGALDEFVLKWRVIAKRVVVTSGSNHQLRISRFADIARRVSQEELVRPRDWPKYKLDFVEELLKAQWPE